MFKTVSCALFAMLIVALCVAPAEAQVKLSAMRWGSVSVPASTNTNFYTVPADSYLVITDISWSSSSMFLLRRTVGGIYEGLWTGPAWEGHTSGSGGGTAGGFLPESHFVTGVVFGPGEKAAATGNIYGGLTWRGYLVSTAAAVGAVDGAGPPPVQLGAVPNPARGSSSVRFSLPASQKVVVAVFDVQGRRVRTLFTGVLPAGDHALPWDGRDEGGALVADGTYFARLDLGTTAPAKKISRIH